LQKKLVAEMRGRIKEDDSSVPAPDGPYAICAGFAKARQHELFGRTPPRGGEAEIILDGDKLAADHKYFKFGGARHSPDHKLQAWSAGRKRFGILFDPRADWTDGADLDDVVEETDGRGGVEPGPAGASFYVKLDDNHRPMQVLAPSPRHAAGGRCSGP